MTTTPSKVIRIQDEEKELLFRLRKIYANDYKKYSEHIKRESNIIASIKKIYTALDERQAYRRISDFFHRKRLANSGRRLYSNGYKRSSRLSNRNIPRLPVISPVLQRGYDEEELDDDSNHQHHQQQQSNDSTLDHHLDETADSEQNSDAVNASTTQVSDFNSIYQQKQSFPINNNGHHQPAVTTTSQTSKTSAPDLLTVRASIQKALHELDRIIIPKFDGINHEDGVVERQQQSIRNNNFLINGHRGANLDDIVRSLSNIVTEQQDNVHLIINESSTLLVNDNQRLENLPTVTKQSITYVLQRLNALVDRGHSIYDKVERILSEF